MRFNEKIERYVSGLEGILEQIETYTLENEAATFDLLNNVDEEDVGAVKRLNLLIQTNNEELEHLNNNFYVHFKTLLDVVHYEDEMKEMMHRVAGLVARSELKSLLIEDFTDILQKEKKERKARLFVDQLVKLASTTDYITDLSELK